MIVTGEGAYCPSSGELYDFDMRRHVLSIICQAIWFWPETARTVHLWVALSFWPDKARTVHHLWSSMILTVEGTHCPSSGELHDFEMRKYVLSIIWRATWFWDEEARTVHHLGSYLILTWEGTYCPSSEDLYDLDRRGHVLSTIWGALWY